MEKKMTYVDALDVVLADLADGEVKDKLTALRASIQKRNASDRKPSKTQVANEGLKADILAYLADGELHTVTEIMAGVASLEGASNQKVATLVTQLVKAELVTRQEIKRKAYFKVAWRLTLSQLALAWYSCATSQGRARAKIFHSFFKFPSWQNGKNLVYYQ